MENTKKKLIVGLFQASLFPALMVAGWFYYPVMNNGPVLCLWRNFVGVNCYGCGMTRAVCEMSHGHVAAAMQQNKLVIPLLSVLFIISYVGAVKIRALFVKSAPPGPNAKPVVTLTGEGGLRK